MINYTPIRLPACLPGLGQGPTTLDMATIPGKVAATGAILTKTSFKEEHHE
jgi:hypothetical protein